MLESVKNISKSKVLEGDHFQVIHNVPSQGGSKCKGIRVADCEALVLGGRSRNH